MKNILITDDNRFFLDGLLTRLSLYLPNCHIAAAESGKRALEILVSSPIDLLVTDLDMPHMDGHELLISVRKNHPDLPVFVMTANCDSAMEKKLEALGSSRCIDKPFGFKELSDMIEAELGVPSPAAA
jgi:CheY-like chemotaxis protein